MKIIAIFASIKRFISNIPTKNMLLRHFFVRIRHVVFTNTRYSLAKRFIRGSGIEIGALNSPLVVPWRARVKYVDRLRIGELRVHYPELKRCALIDPDIIDDGERLDKIDSRSQDFLIANHLLEHCENPIGAIESFLRVLKKDGILYLAVPDKRFTFDNDRPITTLKHIIKDHIEGPVWSHAKHFDEWQILVDKKFRDDFNRQIKTLKDNTYSIHFHVWTYLELLELLAYLKKKLCFEFEIEEFIFCRSEAIFILRKGNAI